MSIGPTIENAKLLDSKAGCYGSYTNMHLNMWSPLVGSSGIPDFCSCWTTNSSTSAYSGVSVLANQNNLEQQMYDDYQKWFKQSAQYKYTGFADVDHTIAQKKTSVGDCISGAFKTWLTGGGLFNFAGNGLMMLAAKFMSGDKAGENAGNKAGDTAAS